MTLRLTSRACADLASIARHFEETRPAAAAPVFGAIERCFGRIHLMPYLGRPTNVRDVRCLVVPHQRYKIFYRINGETIEVLTILHEAQDADLA